VLGDSFGAGIVDHLSKAELAKMDAERADIRRASMDLRRASMLDNCFEMEDTMTTTPGKPAYLEPVEKLHGTVSAAVGLKLTVRLHRMHEMQTIVTDVRGVCLSLCPSVCLSVCHECTE